MRDPIEFLIEARGRLIYAQGELYSARRAPQQSEPRKIFGEQRVKFHLDQVWEAQLAAAAELIVLIGVDHAVRIGLGWKDTE